VPSWHQAQAGDGGGDHRPGGENDLARARTWVTVSLLAISIARLLAFKRGVIGETANRRKIPP